MATGDSHGADNSCPIGDLLPGGGADTAAAVVVSAARQRLADRTASEESVAQVLVHVLTEHPRALHPEVAVAIRELTPWVAQQAADAVRPSVPGADAALVYGSWPDMPALYAAIALAILDPDEGTRASALLGKSTYPHIGGDIAAWYARISLAHREEIAARYVAEAARCRHAQQATFFIKALVDLGPDQYPKARAAIDEIFSWGKAPGAMRRPLSGFPPDFLPEAVAVALRSLRHDPGYFMPQRGGGRTNAHGGAELVLEEVLALADPVYTRGLAGVLGDIAADEAGSPVNRWRAAFHLAMPEIAAVDPTAHQRAIAMLTEARVKDPEWRPADKESWTVVTRTWRRIESSLKKVAPQLLDKLGPPATREEAMLCQQVFGFPDVFAASIARHRRNWIGLGPEPVPCNGDLFYEDMIQLLQGCRCPDGTYDTSDPGELPDFAFEHGWLTALQAWADELEAVSSV